MGAFSLAAMLAGTGTSKEMVVSPRAIGSYGNLPLSFEANQGQTDSRVKYLAHGSGYTLFLTNDGAALSFQQGTTAGVLRMKLNGGNRHAAVKGADPLPGKSNYLLGRDPAQWHTNVPTYAAVKYKAVYPGIDLVYHGNQRLLEYDFVVAAGADPAVIDVTFEGAREVRVNGKGDLVIEVGDSEVIEHAPVVYQELGGKRQSVAGRYVLRGNGRVGFEVEQYDRSRALVLDPVLVYSTYLGGSTGFTNGSAIAVDGSGSAYVTGMTVSTDFPGTPGAFQALLGGTQDGFVSKLNATGSALIYSTYLGGSDDDYAASIAIDASGNAYLVGWTRSSNFPTTPAAFQTVFHGSGSTFVCKLNSTGSTLVYSTYLGDDSNGSGIAIDTAGNAYVTGTTGSTNFPTTPGAFQTEFGADVDFIGKAFVSKLNAAGSALVYSTYLSGSVADYGMAIAVDTSGSAYVTGANLATDFPTTPGAFQTTFGMVFVSKLNTSGSALVYSTYLGGASGTDQGSGIAVDAYGNAYVTGRTGSPSFPTTPGAFQTTSRGGIGTQNAFVTKLSPTGSALVYSTYLGGSYGAGSSGIRIDDSGNTYITGFTRSTDFPITPDAVQTTYAGDIDAFVTKLNSTGSSLLYSTYLGGQTAYAYGIGIDHAGCMYITGNAGEGFPTTAGAFQHTYTALGSTEAFVSKLCPDTPASGPVTIADVNGVTGNTGWYLGIVTVTLVARAGNSPVSATYYRLDNGPYLGYAGPFTMASDGVHQLLYYSVDTAGNQEAPHGQTIKIDATKSVSHVAALPANASSPNFSVQWSGADSTSGIASYSIYVSDNGGAFAPWLSHVTATQAYYSGSLLHTYSFYSVAIDNAGNVETKTAADATTHVPQSPGDANGDGRIDCADVSIVKACFGKRTGQTGFDARADINGDGVVDVHDLALMSQQLAPGTRCP